MKELHLMASRHSVFYTPLIGTISGKFLEKEGLKASYSVATPNAPAVSEAASGRIDVAQSAVSSSWAYLDKGERPPIAHFAQINRYDGFFVASREPCDDFDWKRLLSGRFMYVHGGQPEAMLRYALHIKGVDLDETEGINASDTEAMMERWRSGEGDFFHEQGAYPQQLEHEGNAHIVASIGEVIGPVAFSSLCCRREWLKTEEAKRFTNAYRKSREWANTADPLEISRTLVDFFPRYALEAISKAISFYQQLGTWSEGIDIEPRLYETALDVFAHSSMVKKRHPFDEVVIKSLT